MFTADRLTQHTGMNQGLAVAVDTDGLEIDAIVSNR